MAQETTHPNGRSAAKVTSIDSAKPRKKAARRSKKKDPAIQETLDTLTAAMTAGDGKACADLWLTPAFFVGDDMLKAVEDPAAIAEWFGGAKAQYAEKGITDTRAEIETIEWLTDQLVLVSCRFPYLDDQGAERGEERSTYTLRKEEDGSFKFCVAIMRGASEDEKVDMEEAKTAEDAN
jgi:ketosteroid isomerase-like protein